MLCHAKLNSCLLPNCLSGLTILKANHPCKPITWSYVSQIFFCFLSLFFNFQAWDATYITRALQILRFIVSSCWKGPSIWICNMLVVCVRQSDSVLDFFVKISSSLNFRKRWHLHRFCTLHSNWSWLHRYLWPNMFFCRCRCLFFNLSWFATLKVCLLVSNYRFWLLFSYNRCHSKRLWNLLNWIN